MYGDAAADDGDDDELRRSSPPAENIERAWSCVQLFHIVLMSGVR